MKKVLGAIIAIAIVAVIVVFIVFAVKKDQTVLNTGYVNGNTAGNLYNSGLFCESEGTIFFANPDDDNSLYSMDLDGSNLKKLCNDTVLYINADSHYVYYVRRAGAQTEEFGAFSFATNSLCRISRDGGNTTILDADPCIYPSLIGNYIYYLHYDTDTDETSLYKIKIDGSERTMLTKNYLFTCSSLGQYFYYNGMNDGNLYQYNTATDTTSLIYECNCYKPIVTSDNNVYYLDVDNDNALVHTNTEFGNPTTLTEDSIDLYNVYGSYIYYIRYSEDGDSGLCMIKNDGTDFRQLLIGDYSGVFVTSDFIFVTDYSSGQVYSTPTENPGEFTPFNPGKLS
ncbi:MAG: DUF5050 domain-containing protein [Clostridiales bacterium]|nr:DUF5050 domain-containing protein [Clostridiales bacterium]